MNLSLLSSIQGWLTTGRTFSWLHYLPLLFGSCSVLYLLVIAAKTQTVRKYEAKGKTLLTTKSALPFWKKLSRTVSLKVVANERAKWATRLSFLLSPRKMIQMWREWNQERDRAIEEEIKRPRGWAYLYLIAWVCLVFLSAFAVTRPPKYPIETHHNVYVWSQVKGAQEMWWISGDDLPFNTWKCCPDFPCDRNIRPGYIADTLKYEERGDCKSIRASNLGIWWKTDEHGNVKEW
jgi:hypothetical protein